MGVGPIPRSKTREYARDVLDLSGDAHDLFCDIIGHVDGDYISMQNETKNPSQEKMRSTVSTDDPEAVSGLLDRLANKPAKSAGVKSKPNGKPAK